MRLRSLLKDNIINETNDIYIAINGWIIVVTPYIWFIKISQTIKRKILVHVQSSFSHIRKLTKKNSKLPKKCHFFRNNNNFFSVFFFF